MKCKVTGYIISKEEDGKLIWIIKLIKGKYNKMFTGNSIIKDNINKDEFLINECISKLKIPTSLEIFIYSNDYNQKNIQNFVKSNTKHDVITYKLNRDSYTFTSNIKEYRKTAK